MRTGRAAIFIERPQHTDSVQQSYWMLRMDRRWLTIILLIFQQGYIRAEVGRRITSHSGNVNHFRWICKLCNFDCMLCSFFKRFVINFLWFFSSFLPEFDQQKIAMLSILSQLSDYMKIQENFKIAHDRHLLYTVINNTILWQVYLHPWCK